MTIDEVMILTPEQVQRRVAELLGWTSPGCNVPDMCPPDMPYSMPLPNWHTDLNAAMQLVPQGEGDGTCFFIDCLEETMQPPPKYEYSTLRNWMFECPDKPLAICRAFIAWKDGAK